ncbi:ornithine cyclodeaminase family protein [Bacillus sp. H-16]|uniref:ornithine cyclodeaminase family protein n=1 Tax=Alteribacter salitolerans TaxID=2912333 RepID=UPI0019659D70|nr:ornithine cyclodeaminase family protein [Alteribacter salitolerans]MBM7095791.1 ornithine cyclodeaminase family protein [Alteribacter salitolerans]
MHMIDHSQITELITMHEVIEAIEDFYLNGNQKSVVIPERMHEGDGDNTILLMPSFFENYYGTKMVGVAPNNPSLGKDTIHAQMLLCNRETLEPLALMDAQEITALRTGALGGISMKYLASDTASTIGIVGSGVQAFSHLQAACAVRPIKRVLVYSRKKESVDRFTEKVNRAFPELDVAYAETHDLMKQSEIIVTATSSKSPVLPELSEKDLAGKHIVGCGSFRPFMQEIPDFVFKQINDVYVDNPMALKECGELIQARELGITNDHIFTLEDLIQNSRRFTSEKEKLTVFKSVGLAIYDLVTAIAIHKKR